MIHAPVEVSRTERQVYMRCDGCGDRWIVMITSTRNNFGFSRHQCPSVQGLGRRDRRRARAAAAEVAAQ